MYAASEPGQQPERNNTKKLKEPNVHRRSVLAYVGDTPRPNEILSYGEFAAKALDANLTLVNIIDTSAKHGELPDPIASDLLRREASTEIGELAQKKTGPHDIETVTLEGCPAEQLCKWARDHDIELTIMNSRPTTERQKWKIDEAAREIFEQTSGSVLLLPIDEEETQSSALETILVFLDGSSRAECALSVAVKLARSTGSNLVLVHAVPVPELTKIGPPEKEDDALRASVLKRNRQKAETYFKRLDQQLRDKDVSVETRVIVGGDPRHSLIQCIHDENADMIVVTSQGHSGHADVAVGSVTNHLIEHSPIPLFVVRSAKDEARSKYSMPNVDPTVRLPHRELM
ncbi:MAG: universal stress protein [Henriciella sp.]|nr:universal stress protein [Henriciella sp.]